MCSNTSPVTAIVKRDGGGATVVVVARGVDVAVTPATAAVAEVR
jgi:hypothetical protein